MMNVGQVAQRLVAEVPSIGPKEARKRIARAIKALNEMHEWSHRLSRSRVTTEAQYATGTVAIANGGTAVTLTSGTWDTAWSTAPSSRRIFISGRPEPYDITIASTTTGQLSDAWAGTTQTAASYVLFRDTYPLPTDCDYGDIMRIVDADPAVSQGLMRAELFPYRVALMEGRSG